MPDAMPCLLWIGYAGRGSVILVTSLFWIRWTRWILHSDGNFLAANRCLGTLAVVGRWFIVRIDCSIGSKIILLLGAAFNSALMAASLLILSTESFRECFVGEPLSDTDFVVLFDGDGWPESTWFSISLLNTGGRPSPVGVFCKYVAKRFCTCDRGKSFSVSRANWLLNWAVDRISGGAFESSGNEAWLCRLVLRCSWCSQMYWP